MVTTLIRRAARVPFLGSAVVTSLLVAAGCRSPIPPTRLDPELGTQIDAILTETVGDEKAPGYAVMVVRDGVIAHAKGYGLAELATDRPITRSTPFRLASLTKQFTCMAIMKLAEQGRLSIDDPAVDYVPSLARFDRGVTIRRLMQHTSGLPEYYEVLERREYAIPSADDDPLLTARDATALFEEWGELTSEPGARFAYSNPGYEQLGLVIEAASGKTYSEYLRDAVLTPAGMPTAVVRDRPERQIPNRAIGYDRVDDAFVELDDHPGNWILGAGGLYASLDDLYLWDRALTHYALVSRPIQDQAFEPVTLADGKVSSYGFGWGIDSHDGHARVGHGGGWVGFRTYIARYPDDGLTIVVLSNFAGANPGHLARRVAELAFASGERTTTEGR